MWRLIALLFLSIFPASSVLAWNEPTGFRDIPWGTKPEVVRQRFPDLGIHLRRDTLWYQPLNAIG